MIRSMTGYGRAEATGTRLAVAAECKSVNHRHLDIALKLPRAIATLEPDVRRLVQAALVRGRIDVSVSVSSVAAGALTSLSFDMKLAREYTDMARRMAEELQLEGGPSLGWVLAQPGVILREA